MKVVAAEKGKASKDNNTVRSEEKSAAFDHRDTQQPKPVKQKATKHSKRPAYHSRTEANNNRAVRKTRKGKRSPITQKNANISHQVDQQNEATPLMFPRNHAFAGRTYQCRRATRFCCCQKRTWHRYPDNTGPYPSEPSACREGDWQAKHHTLDKAKLSARTACSSATPAAMWQAHREMASRQDCVK